MRVPDGDKWCRVTLRRAMKALRLSALPQGGLAFKAAWIHTSHCERVIYRHYHDLEPGWQP